MFYFTEAPSTQSPDPQGLRPWLRLMLTPGLGPATAHRLLQAFEHPEAIFEASANALAAVLGAALAEAIRESSASREQAINQQLQALDTYQRSCRLFTLFDKDYPAALLQTPNPPPLLCARGRLSLLERPALAMVGSRAATHGGMRTAREFSSALGAAGLTIISGLALGIDAAAHEGALPTPASSIAVLGCGVDGVYPRRNYALYQQMLEHGLLLSEQPIGSAARPAHFPARNRIIAALSRATLVVEAARESGSLITAKLANDIGRDVMAIPGSIHATHSKGCHWLLKQGAKLVETADDVLLELAPGFVSEKPSAKLAGRAQSTATETALLGHIGHHPVDLEELQTRCAQSAEQLLAELLGLELAGRIERLADGRFLRTD